MSIFLCEEKIDSVKHDIYQARMRYYHEIYLARYLVADMCIATTIEQRISK